MTLTAETLVQQDLPYLVASRVQCVLQVDLRRVVRVRAELHRAVLPVKWEISNLDRKTCIWLIGRDKRKGKWCWRVCVCHLYSTWAAVECRGSPSYPPSTVSLNMDMQGHIEHPIIAANRDFHMQIAIQHRLSGFRVGYTNTARRLKL